jgi:hypothetical protein
MISAIACHDTDQTADILTKALAWLKHKKHMGKMGLVPIWRGVLRGSEGQLQVLPLPLHSKASASIIWGFCLQETPYARGPQEQHPYRSPCTRWPLAWMPAYIVGTYCKYILHHSTEEYYYSIHLSHLLYWIPIRCPPHTVSRSISRHSAFWICVIQIQVIQNKLIAT